jgi:hypothetical protein
MMADLVLVHLTCLRDSCTRGYGAADVTLASSSRLRREPMFVSPSLRNLLRPSVLLTSSSLVGEAANIFDLVRSAEFKGSSSANWHDNRPSWLLAIGLLVTS